MGFRFLPALLAVYRQVALSWVEVASSINLGEITNFSTARKSGNISHILKAFFVRNSSEYETSDSVVSYSDECRTTKAFCM